MLALKRRRVKTVVLMRSCLRSRVHTVFHSLPPRGCGVRLLLFVQRWFSSFMQLLLQKLIPSCVGHLPCCRRRFCRWLSAGCSGSWVHSVLPGGFLPARRHQQAWIHCSGGKLPSWLGAPAVHASGGGLFCFPSKVCQKIFSERGRLAQSPTCMHGICAICSRYSSVSFVVPERKYRMPPRRVLSGTRAGASFCRRRQRNPDPVSEASTMALFGVDFSVHSCLPWRCCDRFRTSSFGESRWLFVSMEIC